jgi:hypothetical protein
MYLSVSTISLSVDICDNIVDHLFSGDLELVYTSLNSLAEYFEEANDIWLADHFHKRCLETSLLIKNDGRRREGEAHCNMGLSYESKGSYYRDLNQRK